MSSTPISVWQLTPQSISAQEKARILDIMLTACRGDLQVAALTGGRSSLEPALFQFQLDICLMQGVLFVAGRGNKIDGVLLAFGPGQDIFPKSAIDSASYTPSAEYVSKLSPEMQQWWSSHFRPKFAELTNLGLGSDQARKDSWYIRMLIVHPNEQRRGIGSKLIETIVQKANSAKKKACLEVHTDTLVRIFTKYNFRVRATKNFGSYQGGFPFFLMVREPSTV
ncbi:acyl- N-acyltransferase [Pyrrhoderma noxium]|uniref:Acyl-N-acyltransferase n=1 Tax=Pyrrhoderma noxium TaxID=2282107 RepID=A0A286UHS9_9AGAM|nr:acyl- N-acyltransferase [Pyrrhoderma noxium]